MQQRLGDAWLVADFFSHAYRISGRVNVRQSKLADQLNDQTTAFLQLQDVYVSSIDHPADITASHPTSILHKRNVTAVIVAHQEDGLPKEHSYGSYFGTYLREVFITFPSFEVEGNLRLSGRLDLRTVLTSGTDDFISILDGQMKSSVRPDITFSGGAILINKTHVGAFWVKEEE